MTDAQLLQRYVQNGDQHAFAELVKLHVDVVYSAARRQAHGDNSAAEEITQQVFILLAQKAKTLSQDVLIGGWLYNAVRFVARDEIRKEQRRAAYEQKAAAMTDQLRKASAPAKSDAWNDAEQVLDEAMADLDEPTRGLLVLRYFQGQSAGEVAQRLGISEEAARKRISRGVEQLRDVFARRGVVLSAALLTEALATQLTIHAPAHLAASAAAAATSSISTTTSSIAGGAAIMAATTTTKLVTAAVITVVALGAVVGGVQAVRYLSIPSGKGRTISLADNPTKITGPKLAGQVLGPDGKPVASAEIRVGMSAKQANAYPGTERADAIANKSGQYEVAKPDGNYVIVVRSSQGYAEVSSQKLAGGGDIRLQPWGRIEGVAKAADKVLPRTDVHLWRVGENDEAVHHEMNVTTDAQGRFVFPQVAPGGVQIYRRLRTPFMASADWRYVEVEPGKTTTANVGGSGHSVVGRVQVPPEMTSFVLFEDKPKTYYYEAEVRLEMPGKDLKHDKSETPEEYRAKEEAFARTPEGKIHKEWMFGSAFAVNRDGSFRVDNLPVGKYHLSIRNLESLEDVNFLEDVARTETDFEIQPSLSASSTQPMELGVLTPKAMTRLRPGSPVLAFSVKTIDGKTFNSADHAGKPIVVVFWGTWSNTDKIPEFGKFAAKWAKDPRIAIIGCYLADSDSHAAEIIAKNHLDFPHTNDKDLLGKLDCSWPEAVVIGADGKLLQKHLHGEVLEKYVNKALGIEPPPATKKSRQKR